MEEEFREMRSSDATLYSRKEGAITKCKMEKQKRNAKCEK